MKLPEQRGRLVSDPNRLSESLEVTVRRHDSSAEPAREGQDDAIGKARLTQTFRSGKATQAPVRFNGLQRDLDAHGADRAQCADGTQVTGYGLEREALSAEDASHFRKHEIRCYQLLGRLDDLSNSRSALPRR